MFSFSSLARVTLLAGLVSTLIPVDAALAQVYSGGDAKSGIDDALSLIGFSGSGDIGSFITSLTQSLVSYAIPIAIFAIVVAGFYLLLGFGSDGAKETAKKIILYTLIGILVIYLANEIVMFFFGLKDGTISTNLPCRIYSLMIQAVSYVALIGTVMIVIAGFYLLFGFGSEGAKDTALRIVLYTVLGILLITFAATIVGFAYVLAGGTPTLNACGGTLGGSTFSASLGDVRGTVLGLLDVALGFLALLAVVALVIAGFMMILGLGSESSRDRALRIILYTILGLLVILFARVIIAFFLNLGSAVFT